MRIKHATVEYPTLYGSFAIIAAAYIWISWVASVAAIGVLFLGYTCGLVHAHRILTERAAESRAREGR